MNSDTDYLIKYIDFLKSSINPSISEKLYKEKIAGDIISLYETILSAAENAKNDCRNEQEISMLNSKFISFINSLLADKDIAEKLNFIYPVLIKMEKQRDKLIARSEHKDYRKSEYITREELNSLFSHTNF